MAPTKPKKKSHKDKAKDRVRAKAAAAQNSNVNPRELLAQATAYLENGDPETAAKIAVVAYEHIGETGRQAGAALSLLGQIHVELGEVETARAFFAAAVKTDEDGTLAEDLGGGPEKFLWLAQLSDEGGQDSVAWFERGAAALRSQIQSLTESLESRPLTRDVQEAVIAEKRKRLAETLSAVVEVYMTDLSWEEDAEQRCEALITEATMLAPESAETWQTVANVRISQTRTEEAQEALKRSLGLWVDLAPEDPAVPPFPTRVSLARLLIEVDMEKHAMEVTERLVDEDDRSVEVLYLGGYARYISGEKLKNQGQPSDVEAWKLFWRSSRKWLTQCLKVFGQEEYEDERLGEHAQELLKSINGELGEPAEDGEDGDAWEDTDDEEWEGLDDDEDTEMK
jgi:tetratricopeptide (TPR) repeat protein